MRASSCFFPVRQLYIFQIPQFPPTMTAFRASEVVHVADSLLIELARHTTIDMDNNMASVAVQHNLAHSRMLDLSESTSTCKPQIQRRVQSEFQSLFNDMTSNQIIVLSTFSNLLASEPDKAHKLLETCISTAKQLQAGTWDGKQLGQTLLQRLSLPGLTGNEADPEQLRQLASDILTIHFGLLMLTSLRSSGNLHAQTATSQANHVEATVKHARRFVALYELMSGGAVTSSRVCIKIPSTMAGLQAMRYLSSGGSLDECNLGGPLPEGSIQVLATTVFSVEQGLAAAQAGGAMYIAPYINTLAAHFFSSENPSEEEKLVALSAGKRSVSEVILPLQRCLLRLRKGNPEISTQVMAASFLSIDEAVELCWLDHMTLGASIVAELANTKLTAEYADAMQLARSNLYSATDELLEHYGAVEAAKEAEQLGYGGWLQPGSRSYQHLNRVLTQDERCRYMLADALARFTRAEQELRNLF